MSVLEYSVELQKTLQDDCDRVQIVEQYASLEQQMIVSFSQNASKKSREGNLKMSFIYLLIDPRISENLPAESQLSTQQDIWQRFISSIFYVGKGKSSRPYAHLYDAIKLYEGKLIIVNLSGSASVMILVKPPGFSDSTKIRLISHKLLYSSM